MSDRALAAAERLGMPDLAAPDAPDEGCRRPVQGADVGGDCADGGRPPPGRAARPHARRQPGERCPRQHPRAGRSPRNRGRGARDRGVRPANRHREQETVTVGNMAEDIRRTGDWDWIIGRGERAIRDEDRNVTDLLLEAALMEFRIFRGEAGRPELGRDRRSDWRSSTTSTSPWRMPRAQRRHLRARRRVPPGRGAIGSSSRTTVT